MESERSDPSCARRHIIGRDGDRSPAKQLGMTVLSTTRNPAKDKDSDDIGVDHVVIDGGSAVRAVRQLRPDGVDGALELVRTPTLPDVLRCIRLHGVACFTGMPSNQSTVEKAYPIDTSHEASVVDLLQRSGGRLPGDDPPGLRRRRPSRPGRGPHRARLPPRRDRRSPHAMEDGAKSGKLVVTTGG
jgi:NADPH:quinone reductase